MTPPSHIRIKLENLAEMTGWGVSTFREAAKRGELGVKRRGQWVASLSEYDEWLNAETRQQGRENPKDSFGQVASNNQSRGEVGKRANSRKKVGRATSPARKTKGPLPILWETNNGARLSIEQGGSAGGNG